MNDSTAGTPRTVDMNYNCMYRRRCVWCVHCLSVSASRGGCIGRKQASTDR